MARRIADKWRPPLSWIVCAVLLAVLSLPAAVVIWFRALDATPSRMGPVELTALGVAVLLTLVIAAVFSRTITGPINALIRTTEAIGKGGSAAIAAPERHGNREVAVLSQTFLDLAERLVERTEYVHSFAAHVSHELKSPLTAIRGSAELLLDGDMDAADRRRFAAAIVDESERLGALLERLRTLAEAEVPLDGKGATLATVAAALRRRLPAWAIVVEGEAEAALALSEEAALVVFGHLADNAAQHGARALALTATVSGGRALIVVEDDGSGISPGNRGRVFEPFFTTRRDEGGTGTGLGVVRSMLGAHGGSIALEPSERGARFAIAVPVL